jgi:predicted nucleotidyltransferase component of viral defense system
MNSLAYKKQVALLLEVLPFIAEEDCFALHGGTAINLFVRNMARLSIDIDLTYLPVESREKSIDFIRQSLSRIKVRIEKTSLYISVVHKEDEAKLLVSNHEALIKVEVNLIKRGCFSPPIMMQLCDNAQKEYGVFCEIQVVDEAHLFGGKICAALDRQHPRDLFDVHYLMETNSLSHELKKGFLFYLISSNRPVAELLFPNFSDQKSAFESQFSGMTTVFFSYEDFENTRKKLVDNIHNILDHKDREFLYRLEDGNPDWEIYDFKNFPAVNWKLLNINKLKKEKPTKHKSLLLELKHKLEV